MKAPNFKLSSTSGKTVELNKVKSKYIIIYFYPRTIQVDVRLKQMILINF